MSPMGQLCFPSASRLDTVRVCCLEFLDMVPQHSTVPQSRRPVPASPLSMPGCLSPTTVLLLPRAAPKGILGGEPLRSLQKGRAAEPTGRSSWKGAAVCSWAPPRSRPWPWPWVAAASGQGGGRPLIVTLCDDYEVSSLHPHPSQTKGGSPAPSFSLLPVSLVVGRGPKLTRWHQRCSVRWEMGRRT